MVNIPKLGRVRFRWTKGLPVGRRATTGNRITGARLVKDALGWPIAFRVQRIEPAPEPHTGPEVGIDVGVSIPLALSDGNHADHGRPARLPDGRADRDKWLGTGGKATLLRLEHRAAHRKSRRRPGEDLEPAEADLRADREPSRESQAQGDRLAAPDHHGSRPHLRRDRGGGVEHREHGQIRPGTAAEPGSNVATKAGLNRSISQEAWGRTITMLAYKTAQRRGHLHTVPAPGTSLACHMCGHITPGSREDQATFVCKNTGCGWEGNADLNILHLYRTGHALVPAAGRAVVRRPRGVKPTTRLTPSNSPSHPYPPHLVSVLQERALE